VGTQYLSCAIGAAGFALATVPELVTFVGDQWEIRARLYTLAALCWIASLLLCLAARRRGAR